LASTISATIGAGAASVGICYERNGSADRCATAGWYNMATLEEEVRSRGGYLQTLVGDAFSEQTKSDAIEALSHDVGPVDLVVYSVAAKRRRAPSGAWFLSSLKSIGEPFTARGVDLGTREVREMTLPAATPEEIAGTIAVMGGSDWAEWIAALEEANLLAPGATTLAYSYLGVAPPAWPS